MINIYNTIKSLNTTRDCSTNCFNHIRIKGTDPHKCDFVSCANNSTYIYKYNYNCYEKCPSKTHISSNESYVCEYFSCDKYYNYNQTDCIDEIPEGYFLNDTNGKTMDICHPNCKTCTEKETFYNNKCTACPIDRFFYEGDCVTKCPGTYYNDTNDPSISKCNCMKEKCSECSRESLRSDLCIKCNITKNYYPVSYSNRNYYPYNIFFTCSRDPQGFYFDSDDSHYKECYISCKECVVKGDQIHNNCILCNNNYTFKNDFPNDTNCYENCSKFYYYDNQNIHKCTEECPDEFPKFIEAKKRCIDDCKNDNIYKYEYNGSCYRECPSKTILSLNIPFLCEFFDCNPYYDYIQKNCSDIVPEGYFLNSSYEKTIDKCHPNCKTCEQKETLENNNCETCPNDKFYYGGDCVIECPNGQYTDINDLSKEKCYCPDISCSECSMEGLNLSLCISCNNTKGYYPILYKDRNFYPYNKFYNCSIDPQGYYFDANDSFYKPCYFSCKTCNVKGDEMNNNCLECNNGYSFKTDFPNDTNCYQICNNFYYFDNQRNYHCINNTCPSQFSKKIVAKKRCIDNCINDNIYLYEYNNECYKECPKKTRDISNNYKCIFLNCAKYYNFNQTYCIDEIPEGYYLNDSNGKTIDKCHRD